MPLVFWSKISVHMLAMLILGPRVHILVVLIIKMLLPELFNEYTYVKSFCIIGYSIVHL